MAKEKSQIFSQKRWIGGIANFLKEDAQQAFWFAQSIDYRTDPNALTLLPASLKESGSTVTDLLKWADTTPENLDVYLYGSTGNLYKRTTGASWSLIHQSASSHGNGLAYFYGDDYLYYANDATIGRYGPIASTPQYTDDFLKAQGGVPQNTASLLLASASSMYADAADSASLEITGNITLETFFKANSLPTVGNSMTLLGKWDESGATRGYKLDLFGVSGFFGSGADGSLTISTNTTESPIDSTCTGTVNTQTLSATNASFAAGQVILIHQSQGINAGQWERNTIQGYTAGTITLGSPLKGTYTSGAQVRTIPQYTTVTINTGVTWTAKAWNGTTGGILTFLASGTVTITGTISANSVGFRGANTVSNDADGLTGEGNLNGTYNVTQQTANGSGGGGGQDGSLYPGGYPFGGAGGGGGGNGTVGGTPGMAGNGLGGNGGIAVGSADLTTMLMGGGGGSGGTHYTGNTSGAGATGGGIIFINATTLVVTGSITAAGGIGGNATGGDTGGGGGGAGGSILLKAQTATLGSALIIANGGVGGTYTQTGTAGGTGGAGRIDLNYLTSYSGTTTPTLNVIQDNNLVTTVTIQARLGISNDGTSFEYLTQNLNSLMTSVWNRLSVAWTASTSTAVFYLNAVSIGSSVGTKTSISSNAALLYVGANKGASSVGNFFDGLLNDMRIWNTVRTSGQIYANNVVQLVGSEAGLQAYYTFNSVYTDKTSNSNTLTAVNSPTFSADVPFPAPTTRLDIDQKYTTSGNTYALKTSISENTADQLPFAPALDPQKSVDFNINAKGTGNWTVTVHDQQNNVIASQTTANANLPSSGWYEFAFSTPWRIVINKSYHMHLTSTVNDGTAVSSSSNLAATLDFHTYYGFLVTDVNFHPITRMLNKIVIGNERYLATWDGASYNANLIAFPPQTHVRCFGFWRDYLAIGTWQETAAGTGNIYDWNVGRIYFWDGISLTFNFWIDVAEGQVNALYGVDTNLYILAGYNGYLLVYQGGYIYASGNSISAKMKKIPYLSRSDYVEVYPQGVTEWRSLLHIGYAANSNSTTLPRAVYSWGTTVNQYPESLSCDYPISTGNTGNTVKIGLVYGAGQSLLIGWQDGNAYGCDQISMTNAYAATGQLQTLIQDEEEIWKYSRSLKVRVDHLTLPSGTTVTPMYQFNRSGTFLTTGAATDADGKHSTVSPLASNNYEAQYGFKLTSTGANTPTVLGLTVLNNTLETEQQV